LESRGWFEYLGWQENSENKNLFPGRKNLDLIKLKPYLKYNI